MFTGIIFLPVIILLLIPIVAIYLFATKRIKLALILLSAIVLLPIIGRVLLNVEKKITEQDLKLISAKIPTYRNASVTSNYIKTPSFSFFDDSFQRDRVTLSIKGPENVERGDVVKFYDSWFKENGWTKTVTDVLSGQHHYIKGNTSAHLWLRDSNLWTIEIAKR